jgi:hypothetical protein
LVGAPIERPPGRQSKGIASIKGDQPTPNDDCGLSFALPEFDAFKNLQ